MNRTARPFRTTRPSRRPVNTTLHALTTNMRPACGQTRPGIHASIRSTPDASQVTCPGCLLTLAAV